VVTASALTRLTAVGSRRELSRSHCDRDSRSASRSAPFQAQSVRSIREVFRDSALCRSSGQPCANALDDACALELGDRAQHVHLQLAEKRLRVDAFGQAATTAFLDIQHSGRLDVRNGVPKYTRAYHNYGDLPNA